MSLRENISYLIPRDPSIQCWDDRVKLSGPRTKNLIQLGLDELEETMGDKIKVYLRLKPTFPSAFNAYTVLNSNTIQTEAPKDSVSYKNVTNGIGKLIHKFTFTSVLDQSVTQSDLFKKCAVKSITKFINGENYLLMAYGTTSAGKTYTMQGNVDQPGVIPRALDFVFNNLKNNIVPLCLYQPRQYNDLVILSDEQMRKDQAHKSFILSLDLSKCQRYPDVTVHTNSSSGFSETYQNVTFKEMQIHLSDKFELESLDIDASSYKYSVWISMIEIYNEQVYDLLELPNEKGIRTKLTFRDDENGNTFVKNLRYVNVSSGHEAFQILQFGRTNLHFAPTALNQSSSRSHCIFTITLAKFLDYESSSCAIMSRFSFCDLAGMERAKKTLNSKDRLIESKSINTSLSILVKCLTTIKENQNSREKKLIPYRESKLTKLFREAVTGKEQFSLIVNVTTEANLFDETLNVLKFSAIAQKIVPQHVFAKPKMVRPVKKSRFSRLVTDSGCDSKLIDWDAPTINGSKVKEEYSSEIADLQDLIEKLQEELSKERKRCNDIESEIRGELTSKFSEMLKKQRDNNEARLENERERLEEMYERKERRLIKYYEILGRNKRQRRDYENDDDDEAWELEEQKQKIEELQRENEVLNSKNENLAEQIQKLMEEHKNAVAECSTLKFTVAEKDRTIDELKRTIDAKTAGEDSLEAELRRQLEDAKAKLADYKTLLSEAAADYKELEENNKYLRNENEVLEQCLTEQRDEVADRANELAELQKILSHKTITLEKLEEANENLSQKLNDIKGDRENEENLMSGIFKRELETLREQFKMTSAKLDESRNELETVKAVKSELENSLKAQKDISNELERKLFEKESTVEKLISELAEVKSAADDVTAEKQILVVKIKDLNREVEVLQKEIKELIARAEARETSDEVKKELEDVRKNLNDQIEELKTRERDAKANYEALQIKVEAAEDQVQVIPELREEIEALKAEVAAKSKDLENSQKLFRDTEADLDGQLEKLIEEKKEMKSQVSAVAESFIRISECVSSEERKAELRKLAETLAEGFGIELGKIQTLVTSGEDEGSAGDGPNQETTSGENDSSPEKVNRKGKNRSSQKLVKQMENLNLHGRSTRKKVDLLDESVHPSTIKRTNNRRRKKDDNEKKEKAGAGRENGNAKETSSFSSSVKKKGKCYKKLFVENDFDGLTDLNASPIEPEIPRLRPRK